MNDPPLEVIHDGPVARVWLNRPDSGNALDDGLLRALADTFQALGRDAATRVVVLAGRGRSFCSGADFRWMRGMLGHTRDEHLRDSALLQAVYHALHECPRPVIGRIHGPALGGGTGLVAVCDIAVTVPEAMFGAVAVKFWLLPAVIAPYLVARVGPGPARDFMLTGERFSAERAAAIGLVQHVVPAADLDAAIDAKIERLLTTGPRTLAAAKALVPEVAGRAPADVRSATLGAIERLLSAPGGSQEIAAFLARHGHGFEAAAGAPPAGR